MLLVPRECGDAEFLRALTHAATLAVQNSASSEALAELNTRLEERVVQRTAELVQAEKMAALDCLVAGLAHEINNPVSFVATVVAPLRQRLEAIAEAVPPAMRSQLREAEELVDIMARGAERTVAIVKDLRVFSRLGEEQRKSVDLHSGLEASLRLLEPRWRQRITIHRDYGQLPLVECDPGQINEVFMNLLSNACDAIRDHGNIWIVTSSDEDIVHVSVRDDGCGMAPDVVSRVFDPFFTTKDVGGGTGLGLAISHSIVSAHGGRITVWSAPGNGSTFAIVLPAPLPQQRRLGAAS